MTAKTHTFRWKENDSTVSASVIWMKGKKFRTKNNTLLTDNFSFPALYTLRNNNAQK